MIVHKTFKQDFSFVGVWPSGSGSMSEAYIKNFSFFEVILTFFGAYKFSEIEICLKFNTVLLVLATSDSCLPKSIADAYLISKKSQNIVRNGTGKLSCYV